MHVCFPFSLNANTANTHHQALGGDVEQKEEEKMKTIERVAPFGASHRTQSRICDAGFLHLWAQCSPSSQPYILHKTLTHFHDRQLLLTLE